MKFFKKLKPGFSLVEILIAVGIFSIITTSILSFAMTSVRAAQNAKKRNYAYLAIQETLNAITLKKMESWSYLLPYTGAGLKHLTFSDNSYQVVDGSITANDVTLSMSIDNLYRDGSGNVQSTGTIDIHSRKITVNASWTDINKKTKSLVSYLYINDWNIQKWTQTTVADFSAGTQGSTVVTNTSGGEVKLETQVYADWCKPSNNMISYDLPGNGVASGIVVDPGHAFIGTGSNASGYSLSQVNITQAATPVPSLGGTYNGGKTNAVFGETVGTDTYSYLATDTNSSEIDIIKTTTTPYTKVGYFDAPGNGSGLAIYVYNNIGYMVSASKMYIFSLSSRVGSRTSLGSVNLNGTGKGIYVYGNYAYVVTSNTTTQVQIINISNSASPTIVATAAATAAAGVDLYVDPTLNKLYLLTAIHATNSEFFVFNISSTNPTGTYSPIGNYNIVSNSMTTTNALTVVGGGTRAIIVGSGGSEQYQVLNLDTPSSPVKCGSLAVATGINDVASLIDASSNAYSYITTGDASSELKIIQGGPGGGSGNGYGYPFSGTFTSQIYDSQSTSPNFVSIDWAATLPNAATQIKFQIRTGSTAANLTSSTSWYGENGLNTYFTTSTGSYIPSSFPSNRYIQFKAYFASDSAYTPILESVNINYQQ